MKDQTTKQASASQKPNILVRLLALLVTAALALGALTLVVYRDQFNLDAVKRWLALRSVETDASGAAAPFTHAGGDSISFAYLKGGILQCSAAGAHYYSFSGDQYAEEVTPLSQPVLSASSSAGVVYDAGGESLFLFQDGQEAFSLDVDGTLLSARVNDSGWLAVTAQQSGYKGSVTVYNVNSISRKEIIQLNFSSVFVADAAVSPDSKTVAVITIGQENGSFFSQLLLYPVDSSEPSATLSLGNLAVLDLDYEAEQLWVLGEDRLLSVAADGSDYETYSFGRSYLKGCHLGGDGFAVLLLGRYQAGGAEQVLTIDPQCQLIAQAPLRGQVLSFSAAGRYLSLLTGSGLEIYTRDMSLYRALEDTQDARFTALSPNGSALLADSQQAWLYIPS